MDTSTRFFDEHFNKYHPKIQKNVESIVYQDKGHHHQPKPVVKPQRYSVSNFEPEFFKQFYDETEKQFLPLRADTNQLQQKNTRRILKNKDPKKFAFPTFESF